MIIKKTTFGKTTAAALVGGALSLTLAAAPLQAAGTADDVQADPTVVDADGTEMTAEELEMAAEKAEAETEEAAMAAKDGAEEMGDELEAEAEGALATAADAIDDDEFAAELQQQLGLDPKLSAYQLEVTEIDGRYSVNGMIDEMEDYAALEEMLGQVEGVDPSMIDNNVVQN